MMCKQSEQSRYSIARSVEKFQSYRKSTGIPFLLADFRGNRTQSSPVSTHDYPITELHGHDKDPDRFSHCGRVCDHADPFACTGPDDGYTNPEDDAAPQCG